MKEARTGPPVTVKSGPVMENVSTGKDINLLKIPAPKWHEHDGGYYIGPGCMGIMKDPDSGWINYGAYRVQAHDRTTPALRMSKGNHGNLIMHRSHQPPHHPPTA